MLQDGLYGLSYRSQALGESGGGEGLAALRGGRILGSDRWGGLFAGHYAYDAERGISEINVRLEMPPDGELVTGLAAGPSGAAVDISAVFTAGAAKSETVVDIAGDTVQVELTYLGPLPQR